MEGEAAQRRSVVNPLFQKLRRRLDEVSLPDVRRIHPPAMAREEIVQKVAELVKERLHLLLVEERGVCAGLWEIADERSFREPVALLAVDDAELRNVLVLVGPRVEVEIHSPEEPPVHPRIIDLDVR